MAKDCFKSTRPTTNIRCVHLDLKGLPPKPERLLALLDVFHKMRLNAVLVEWEDMFPWTVDQRFRCETAYTPDEINAFVKKAKKLDIELIPLVQCLGHMETPLRYPEYAHLREVPEEIDVLNPLAPGARELVERMVEDALRLTPDIKHFHLGGDEAWSFGSHPDTKSYIEKHGKGALYMHHIGPILDKLNARGIRPILWHDMMIHWNKVALKEIASKADLCVWGYRGSPYTTKEHHAEKYIKAFKKNGIVMWAGSAYKGGDGINNDLPDINRRTENILGWVDAIKNYKMKGIIITAWSRYSTNMVQTVPIEGALDSLALSAIVAYNGKLPKNASAVARELLKNCGEIENFEKANSVLKKITDNRNMAWSNLRILREYMQCASDDPRREKSPQAQKYLTYITKHCENLNNLIPDFFAALDKTTSRIWLERYINERIKPIEKQIFELKSKLQDKN